MASIIERNNRYCVVYYFFDENGKKKQKWESYRTASEAKKRKKEIEYRQELGSFVVPKCNTIRELLDEYVTLYGKSNWTFSTYEGKISLIDNYIIPFLGDMKIKEVNTLVLEKYYQQLLRTKAVPKKSFGKEAKKKLNSILKNPEVMAVLQELGQKKNKAIIWDRTVCVSCILAIHTVFYFVKNYHYKNLINFK